MFSILRLILLLVLIIPAALAMDYELSSLSEDIPGLRALFQECKREYAGNSGNESSLKIRNKFDLFTRNIDLKYWSLMYSELRSKYSNNCSELSETIGGRLVLLLMHLGKVRLDFSEHEYLFRPELRLFASTNVLMACFKIKDEDLEKRYGIQNAFKEKLDLAFWLAQSPEGCSFLMEWVDRYNKKGQAQKSEALLAILKNQQTHMPDSPKEPALAPEPPLMLLEEPSAPIIKPKTFSECSGIAEKSELAREFMSTRGGRERVLKEGADLYTNFLFREAKVLIEMLLQNPDPPPLTRKLHLEICYALKEWAQVAEYLLKDLKQNKNPCDSDYFEAASAHFNIGYQEKIWSLYHASFKDQNSSRSSLSVPMHNVEEKLSNYYQNNRNNKISGDFNVSNIIAVKVMDVLDIDCLCEDELKKWLVRLERSEKPIGTHFDEIFFKAYARLRENEIALEILKKLAKSDSNLLVFIPASASKEHDSSALTKARLEFIKKVEDEASADEKTQKPACSKILNFKAALSGGGLGKRKYNPASAPTSVKRSAAQENPQDLSLGDEVLDQLNDEQKKDLHALFDRKNLDPSGAKRLVYETFESLTVLKKKETAARFFTFVLMSDVISRTTNQRSFSESDYDALLKPFILTGIVPSQYQEKTGDYGFDLMMPKNAENTRTHKRNLNPSNYRGSKNSSGQNECSTAHDLLAEQAVREMSDDRFKNIQKEAYRKMLSGQRTERVVTKVDVRGKKLGTYKISDSIFHTLTNDELGDYFIVVLDSPYEQIPQFIEIDKKIYRTDVFGGAKLKGKFSEGDFGSLVAVSYIAGEFFKRWLTSEEAFWYALRAFTPETPDAETKTLSRDFVVTAIPDEKRLVVKDGIMVQDGCGFIKASVASSLNILDPERNEFRTRNVSFHALQGYSANNRDGVVDELFNHAFANLDKVISGNTNAKETAHLSKPQEMNNMWKKKAANLLMLTPQARNFLVIPVEKGLVFPLAQDMVDFAEAGVLLGRSPYGARSLYPVDKEDISFSKILNILKIFQYTLTGLYAENSDLIGTMFKGLLIIVPDSYWPVEYSSSDILVSSKDRKLNQNWHDQESKKIDQSQEYRVKVRGMLVVKQEYTSKQVMGISPILADTQAGDFDGDVFDAIGINGYPAVAAMVKEDAHKACKMPKIEKNFTKRKTAGNFERIDDMRKKPVLETWTIIANRFYSLSDTNKDLVAKELSKTNKLKHWSRWIKDKSLLNLKVGTHDLKIVEAEMQLGKKFGEDAPKISVNLNAFMGRAGTYTRVLNEYKAPWKISYSNRTLENRYEELEKNTQKMSIRDFLPFYEPSLEQKESGNVLHETHSSFARSLRAH